MIILIHINIVSNIFLNVFCLKHVVGQIESSGHYSGSPVPVSTFICTCAVFMNKIISERLNSHSQLNSDSV